MAPVGHVVRGALHNPKIFFCTLSGGGMRRREKERRIAGSTKARWIMMFATLVAVLPDARLVQPPPLASRRDASWSSHTSSMCACVCVCVCVCLAPDLRRCMQRQISGPLQARASSALGTRFSINPLYTLFTPSLHRQGQETRVRRGTPPRHAHAHD
jgi:hypothetical protein